MTQEDRPVLIFDSGIGGLTVLREIRLLLPYERLVYVADDAGFSYGAWKEGPLKARLVDLFGQLIEAHDPKAIVIACNTAFTLAGELLRTTYPDRMFVGTVPAIKPAAEQTRSGLVSVLATPGTVKRAYTRTLIETFATRCHVRLVGSDGLSEMAERHVRGLEVSDQEILGEIDDCFLERDGRRTDIIVLACTHYPFLTNRFRRLAPWPVDWLDPAEAIARQLVRVLAGGENAKPSPQPDEAIMTSGRSAPELVRFLAGFGLELKGR
jgi:glutamate racemase